MQPMNEEMISKDIDKIIGRLHTLEKKKKRWGLSEEENKELNKLLLKYMKNYYQLIDVVFTNYIEPFLFNDKIVDIKSELQCKYGWDGGLLFLDKDISALLDKASNKKDIISLISELKKEELEMAKGFGDGEYGQEIIELFGSLQNTEEDLDCIGKYIQIRYNIMITMIEEGDNEQA